MIVNRVQIHIYIFVHYLSYCTNVNIDVYILYIAAIASDDLLLIFQSFIMISLSSAILNRTFYNVVPYTYNWPPFTTESLLQQSIMWHECQVMSYNLMVWRAQRGRGRVNHVLSRLTKLNLISQNFPLRLLRFVQSRFASHVFIIHLFRMFCFEESSEQLGEFWRVWTS